MVSLFFSFFCLFFSLFSFFGCYTGWWLVSTVVVLVLLSNSGIVRGVLEFENDELSPSISASSGKFSNSISLNGRVINFLHVGESLSVTYLVDLDDLIATNGLLSVGASIHRKGDASPTYHVLTSQDIKLYVWLNFNRPLPLVATYHFSLHDRTLKFRVFNEDKTQTFANFCGYYLGPSVNTPNAKVVEFPYLPEPVFYFEGESKTKVYWASVYFDKSKSQAFQFNSILGNASGSVISADYPLYVADSTGTMQPLDETIYVTVSDRVEDIFPVPKYTNFPELNFYNDQKKRLMLDMWNSSFTAVSEYFEPAQTWKMECATAPCSVFIISTYRHASTCGDGVILNVLHDDTPLWYRILKGQPEATSNISVTISQSGTSYFYFRVHSQTCIKINSMDCDSTAWRITITSSENSTYTFDNRNDFSSVQGYNNWYYNYIVSGTSEYLSMTYSGSAWTANAVAGSYPQITRGAAHPAMKTSAANLFRAHRNYIAALGEWGITDLAIIIHAWQQHGYDVKFPDMYPSNPSWGGSNDKSSDSMKDLIDTAKSYGNLISLHENYVDMYPDSALYDVAAVARIANGNIKNAWFNRETNVRAHQVSNEYSIRLAQQQQALISQNYKPNAGYEDVDPSNLPLPCINLDNNTRTYPPTIEYHMALKKQLWNQFKKSYNGPLFGEGREKNRYDVYFAGYLDGTEAQVEGKAGAALTPEFSQNVVKTTQFNEGMGYFNRWKSVDQEASIPVPVVMQSMFDRYRLQQIIFGNIGWISMSSGRWGRTTFGDVLAEYHLMQALQFLTHSQRVTDIHYASDSTLSWAPIGTFLSNGGDVYNPVLKIEYEDGLRILANGKQEAVWTGYGAAGAAEFSNNFNNRGFSQWSKIGSTYSPMTWNPSTQRWVAPSATTCRFSPTFNAEIDITGDCRPILLWTPPDEVIQPLSYKDISLVIPLVATKSVVLSIYSGNFATPAQWTLVDQSTYENYNSGKRFTIPSLSRGQSLIFEVSGAGNNTLNLMMTIMATKVFSSSTQQFISVVTETEKKFTLPSNGFVAYSQPDNFLAYTAVHEDGVIVDYSSSNFSVYARSRDSTVRNISDIQVDGSVAFKPGKVNGFDDIYFLGVSTLSRNGAKVFTTSEKVEGQLKYTTEASFILHLEYSATMPPPPATDVAFTFYLPERWILDASKSLKSMFSFGIGDSIYASASTVSLDVETRSLRISMLSQQTISFTFTGTVAPPPTPTPTVTPTPTDVPTSSPSSTTGLPSGESAGSRILVSGFAVFVVLLLLC